MASLGWPFPVGVRHTLGLAETVQISIDSIYPYDVDLVADEIREWIGSLPEGPEKVAACQLVESARDQLEYLGLRVGSRNVTTAGAIAQKVQRLSALLASPELQNISPLDLGLG